MIIVNGKEMSVSSNIDALHATLADLYRRHPQDFVERIGAALGTRRNGRKWFSTNANKGKELRTNRRLTPEADVFFETWLSGPHCLQLAGRACGAFGEPFSFHY